jgi:Putative adhesin
MTHWEFPGSDPIDVFIDLAAGSVALAATPTDVTTVSLAPSRFSRNADRQVSEVRVTFDHGRLEVAGPKRTGLWRGFAGFDLTVTLPEGSRCAVRTASADIASKGELAELDAHTASGDITAAKVTGNLQATTASGDVRAEDTGTAADTRSVSGDIRVTRARGDIRARTASGDVTIASAAESAAVATVSGDVRIGSMAVGRADVDTASGDVVVGVARDVGVYLDLASLSGSVTSQLEEAPPSDDVPLEVRCRTLSGDIRTIRAPSAGAERRQVEQTGKDVH